MSTISSPTKRVCSDSQLPTKKTKLVLKPPYDKFYPAKPAASIEVPEDACWLDGARCEGAMSAMNTIVHQVVGVSENGICVKLDQLEQKAIERQREADKKVERVVGESEARLTKIMDEIKTTVTRIDTRMAKSEEKMSHAGRCLAGLTEDEGDRITNAGLVLCNQADVKHEV